MRQGRWRSASEPIAEFIVSATENTSKLTPLVTAMLDEPIQVNTGETVKVTFTREADAVKLKVHQPEPEKKPHAVFDDIEFDDVLIARMMANIAANGMTLDDLAS